MKKLLTFSTLLLLLTSSNAFSEWSISSFIINKMPLEAEVRSDIEQIIKIQIQSSNTGLQCFPTVSNKQQALNCAKKMDKVLQNLEIEDEENTNVAIIQESIKKATWNDKQKQQLIKELKESVKTNQESLICVSKTKTIGSLNKCFKNNSLLKFISD